MAPLFSPPSRMGRSDQSKKAWSTPSMDFLRRATEFSNVPRYNGLETVDDIARVRECGRDRWDDNRNMIGLT